MTIDNDLRAALADLVAAQPPQPANRVGIARRRYHRRMSVIAAGVGAVVAAVAASLAITQPFASSSRHNGFANLGVDGGHLVDGEPWPWQLDWKPIVHSQSDAQAAVQTWAAGLQGDHAVASRVLFEGVPQGTHVRWVLFESAVNDMADPFNRELISAVAPEHGGSWATEVLGSAPTPGAVRTIAVQLFERRMLLVLAKPGVQHLQLINLGNQTRHVYAIPLVARVGVLPFTASQKDGLAVQADNEASTSLVFYQLERPRSTSIPEAQWPILPLRSRYGAQLTSFTGGGGSSADLIADRSGAVTAVVRCLGYAPVTVQVNAATAEIARCDGTDQVARVGSVGAGQHVNVQISGGEMMAMASAVYVG